MATAQSEASEANKGTLTKIYIAIGAVVVALLVGFIIYLANLPTESDNNSNGNNSNQHAREMSYEDAVSVLFHITSEDVIDIMAGVYEDSAFFIYTGRETCPFCRDFAPLLHDVVEELDVSVLYWDTDEAQVDLESRAIAMGLLGIEGVPSLQLIRNGEVVDQLTNTTSVDAIMQFILTHLD